VSGSGISWALSKSAPHPGQVTMPESHHLVVIGRMPFLPPNQQRQSTEGIQYKKNSQSNLGRAASPPLTQSIPLVSIGCPTFIPKTAPSHPTISTRSNTCTPIPRPTPLPLQTTSRSNQPSPTVHPPDRQIDRQTDRQTDRQRRLPTNLYQHPLTLY